MESTKGEWEDEIEAILAKLVFDAKTAQDVRTILSN